MQWSSDINSGFNNKTNITWLPLHPDYETVNVEVKKILEFNIDEIKHKSILLIYIFVNTPTQFPVGPDER